MFEYVLHTAWFANLLQDCEQYSSLGHFGSVHAYPAYCLISLIG